ncbi:hypothetical protein PoB_002132600 [Plakobranchus ocellatus]|uniref:Uncharacterized protein n=1 Tax=Plakobranchus ocellatus TaxID=259542 RepID=A0AAV3Z672_9GAST|nr:hypothetical protein PoB_002132600 [Plakobranchus ocellatus]
MIYNGDGDDDDDDDDDDGKNNNKIWVKLRESFRGMFKGLNTYMLHIVPNIMIVFGIYEAVLNIHAEMRLEQDLASAEE